MARSDIENFYAQRCQYCAPKAREIFQHFLLIWVNTVDKRFEPTGLLFYRFNML